MNRNRIVVTMGVFGVLLAGLLAFDFSRPRWMRVTTLGLAALGEAIDIELIDDPSRASDHNPIRAYWVSDPYQLQDPCEKRTVVWHDVQSGQFALLPQFDLAVVSPGCRWLMESTDFFTRFEKLNPGAVLLPNQSHQVSEFLLLQDGGGVEGLQLQAYLSNHGRLLLWRPHDWLDQTVKVLPRPTEAEVSAATVNRLFGLARDTALSFQDSVEWRRGWQDGGVTSIAFYDGQRIGRVHHVNRVQPTGGVLEITNGIRELAHSMQLQQRKINDD